MSDASKDASGMPDRTAAPEASAVRERDREFYDRETHYFEGPHLEAFKRHIETVRSYLAVLSSRLESRVGTQDVLELGAGTCTASLLLGQQIGIGRHVCADISISRMKTLAPRVAELVGVKPGPMEYVATDFSGSLPFGASEFDIVLFDGALHHSCNMWKTLGECHRILRDGGVLIATREQYLTPLLAGALLKRLLRSPEVRSGVAENSYLRAQYEYYLRACGFNPWFVPVAGALPSRLLAPLNGIVFAKWSIWAEK